MINFKEVEEAVKNLKSQVETGTLDQTAFEAKLLDMIDVSVDGNYWMFGHKSEQWYRHTGREWVPDHPGHLRVTGEPYSHLPQSASEPAHPSRDSVDMGWLSVALVLLVVLFGVVYSSAL
jgi:hypothetical protein